MEKEDKELSMVVNMIVRTVFPQKIFLFGSRAIDTANKRNDYDIFTANGVKIEALFNTGV